MKWIIAFFSLILFIPLTASAAEIIPITFPVDGEYGFRDDFGDPRSGGRTHEGNDIFAEKMTPVVAAKGGVVTFAPNPEPSYGYMLTIKGDDGYTYRYIHLNNDTPGTDDGNGGAEHAYAPGISRGVYVKEGQLIGWLGDSGNAEWTTPHLHFEIRNADGTAINPYESLQAAKDMEPIPTVKASTSTTINDDKSLSEVENSACESNTLIMTAASSAVYYCGADGGRYVFQNENVYFSWYDDFSSIRTLTAEEMAKVPLRGVVTYKPGTYLVKLQSVPKVYSVSENGTLHWITSEAKAVELYGTSWATLVHDIPDSFFPAYTIGDSL